MKNTVVIMDSEILARTIAAYLQALFGNSIDCFPMTYRERALRLTGRRYRNTDIFILGLFRAYSEGLRAEALFAAEPMINPWRRIVIVGERTIAKKINSPIYWDMGSTYSFQNFFKESVSRQIDYRTEIERLKRYFQSHCFKPRHRQHP